MQTSGFTLEILIPSRVLPFLLLAATVLRFDLVAAAASQPNIIVIVADDLGWHDLGVQDAADLKTPAIDSLATNGVRFTRGYVTAPVCSPSRAGLITGRYQQRFGHETNPGRTLERDPHFGLPLTEQTIADRLKPLGYATGWIGKSHLGGDTNLYHPLKRGFDEFFGFIESHHFYFNESGSYTNDHDPILRNYTPVDETNYLTYAFARECVSFITNHAGGPFFLYAPFNATHFPLEAPGPLLAQFSHISDLTRRTNAAILLGLDIAVSNIVKTLRDQNLETNTLIFFTSDNGGATDFGSINTPLRGGKSDLYEGGVRVPFIASWPGRLPANTVLNGLVSTLDILPTCLAAANETVPAWWQLDGVDLLPYATGATADSPHTNLFWRIETNGSLDDDVKDGVRAVRAANWKLVKQGVNEPWELYDLSLDPSETNNLASAQPAKLRELISSYDAWSAQLAPGRYARDELNYRPAELVRQDIRLGTAGVSYFDPEFLPGGAQVAFRDATSNLWVGAIDPRTGWFVSADGRDSLVDTNLPSPTVSLNALEWGISTNAPALFYTKQTPAGRRQIFRARDSGGGFVKTQLTASVTNDNFVARVSQEATNASVKLIFNFGNTNSFTPLWADEFIPSATALMLPATNADNGSWIPGSQDFVYVGWPAGATNSQLMRLNTGNGSVTTLTDSPGDKTDVCAFLAPELNGELLFLAVVGGTNLAVFHDAHDNPNGYFTPLVTLAIPAAMLPSTNLTQVFIHSLRALPGGRGFNGVSYFTCALHPFADPLNPGGGAVLLFGIGPSSNDPILRRLDDGTPADRRDPKLFVGEREVFCAYSRYDGANPVQLRVTRTGITSPDYAGGASEFTWLPFTRSFAAGTTDTGGNAMNPTEILAFATHDGKLFAATGSKGFHPYPTTEQITNNAPPTNWSGAVILVKDSPNDNWRVDDADTNDLFRIHIRAETLREITLTTDADGNPFDAPRSFLVSGLADIGSIGATAASARLRDDTTARWDDSHVATTTEPANTISFGTHRPLVGTNYFPHHVFAGLSNGRIQRGGFDTNTNNLKWTNGLEFNGGGPVTGFAECGGKIYAAIGLGQVASNAPITGGLYVRNDATTNWTLVYQPPHPVSIFGRTNDDFTMSGLTAAPNPNGDDNEILLVARAWPGVIDRIEPGNSNAVVTELDVRDFYARLWNDDRVRGATVRIAYSGFTCVTNPLSGERVHLIGVWLEHPDVNAASHDGTHFLIRHRDGTYESADILNDGYSASLRATRCIAASPFATERDSFYFGGYDAGNGTVADTAWIMRGDWTEWPALTITPTPPEALLAWPFTDTSWLLESTPVLGAGVNWQPAFGLPTRSIFGSELSVPGQSGDRFFRLRKP
ncbi:MAG: sulfatase-like hydrolase/transferase [Verrucomicrobiota bacterium]